jgi:hypothetical protein
VARHRYFETFVAPVSDQAQFGEGWYGEEREGNAAVRWMGGSALLTLPAAPPQARLRLRLFAPLHVLPHKPNVEISLNNRVLERFEITDAYTDKVFDVRPFTSLSNELRITTDQVVNPARLNLGADQRDLGLRLDNLEWLAVRR